MYIFRCHPLRKDWHADSGEVASSSQKARHWHFVKHREGSMEDKQSKHRSKRTSCLKLCKWDHGGLFCKELLKHILQTTWAKICFPSLVLVSTNSLEQIPWDLAHPFSFGSCHLTPPIGEFNSHVFPGLDISVSIGSIHMFHHVHGLSLHYFHLMILSGPSHLKPWSHWDVPCLVGARS